jgi:poly(3-hydroxybutyrate) depolymerase
MATAALSPRIGRDALEFRDERHMHRRLVIHTYRPAAHAPDDPVVLVQHGIRRNGNEYRDYWIEAAERHRLLVVATTFGNEDFPRPENYNDGMVVDPAGAFRPPRDWLYAIPPRVIEALRAGDVTRRSRAHLFGHSAGGQFVHRLAATQPLAPYEAIAPANAGWYTLPTLERPFPEGLAGLGLGADGLSRWLACPMAVFAGELDVDLTDPDLPRTPAALAQGPTRFARAQNFVAAGQQEAQRLGVPCNWKLVTVPGVAHNGSAMGGAVARHWFGE